MSLAPELIYLKLSSAVIRTESRHPGSPPPKAFRQGPCWPPSLLLPRGRSEAGQEAEFAPDGCNKEILIKGSLLESNDRDRTEDWEAVGRM